MASRRAPPHSSAAKIFSGFFTLMPIEEPTPVRDAPDAHPGWADIPGVTKPRSSADDPRATLAELRLVATTASPGWYSSLVMMQAAHVLEQALDRLEGKGS